MITISRPQGQPILYDPERDQLTIAGVVFSTEMIGQLVKAAREAPVGPVLIAADGDTLVITQVPANPVHHYRAWIT